MKIESKKKIMSPLLIKLTLFLSVVGPGLVTANLDNDAGGIATYSLAGAQTGYRLMWILIPVTIALMMFQEMSARMGIVSGKGLADLIREKFGLRITFYSLFFLLFADLGNTMAEFAGIAAAGEIFGATRYLTVPICALLVWILVLKSDYKAIERIFIIGCSVFFTYIISGFMVGPNWGEVTLAIVNPDLHSITSKDLPIMVGLLGTSITPWMQFYIQSAVVEKGISTKHLWHSKIDVIAGCTLMLIVTFFIIICCAATIFHAGITNIHDAKDAAVALEPLAGKYASMLFGIGLFNASFFAAAILPLAASYYICQGMGWESGVDRTFKEAPHFFTIFTSMIVIGGAMTLIPGIDLFKILLYSQILNGLLIPIVILFIINLCNDPDIMGEYTNSPLQNFISYILVTLMFFLNIPMVYYTLR
ncbi:MAG: Nramp family divalent metal transporter [Bacteriovorax sp.]|nr:Nramp family divalent metal transporter [Bacteriovorax sp.]